MSTRTIPISSKRLRRFNSNWEIMIPTTFTTWMKPAYISGNFLQPVNLFVSHFGICSGANSSPLLFGQVPAPLCVRARHRQKKGPGFKIYVIKAAGHVGRVLQCDRDSEQKHTVQLVSASTTSYCYEPDASQLHLMQRKKDQVHGCQTQRWKMFTLQHPKMAPIPKGRQWTRAIL